MADSQKSHLFVKDCTKNDSDLDSDTDNIGDDDNNNDDTIKTIPFRTKHAKDKKEMEQVESNCRCSKKAQETLKNVKSRKLNQKDVAEGVYGTLKPN